MKARSRLSALKPEPAEMSQYRLGRRQAVQSGGRQAGQVRSVVGFGAVKFVSEIWAQKPGACRETRFGAERQGAGQASMPPLYHQLGRGESGRPAARSRCAARPAGHARRNSGKHG